MICMVACSRTENSQQQESASQYIRTLIIALPGRWAATLTPPGPPPDTSHFKLATLTLAPIENTGEIIIPDQVSWSVFDK